MPVGISPTAVRFDQEAMCVDLSDGRTLRVPFSMFPSPMHATPAEREEVQLSRVGLHWEGLDEDISVAGLIAGRGDLTQSGNVRGVRRRWRERRYLGRYRAE